MPTSGVSQHASKGQAIAPNSKKGDVNANKKAEQAPAILERHPQLEKIVKKLSKGRKMEGVDIPVYVLSDPYPNASINELGMIHVTSGLLAIAKSDDERAAALAHELAHFELGHLKKQKRRLAISKGLATAANVTLFTLMLYPSIRHWSSPLRVAVDWSKGTKTGLQQLGFQSASLVMAAGGVTTVNGGSRKDEMEADACAVQILQAAGYSPCAALTLLQKLAKHPPGKNKQRTGHPTDAHRLQKLAETISVNPQTVDEQKKSQ